MCLRLTLNLACLALFGCGGRSQSSDAAHQTDSGEPVPEAAAGQPDSSAADDADAGAIVADAGLLALDAGCYYDFACSTTLTCAPATGACGTPCETYPGGPPTAPCGPGFHCEAVQPIEAEQGSCFQDCNPNAPDSCPAGFVCGGTSGHNGCVRYVPQGLGATCQSNEFVVDCRLGYDCFVVRSATGVCSQHCDPLAANPGCPSGLECAFDGIGLGYCATAAFVGGDPAPIGSACTPNSSGQTSAYCGSDGLAFRGTCASNGTDFGKCIKLCATNADCTGGLTCQPANGPNACR